MRLTLLLLLISSSITGFAQNKKEYQPKDWTPEDIINTEYVRSIRVSPDNKMVVWTKRRAAKDKEKDKEKDKFVNDLYLTRLDVKDEGKFKTVPLTQADENDHSPLFSRDGETIYFLSSRDKGKKLWSLSIYGGEPQEVHEFKEAISDLAWLNDSTIALISTEGKSLFDSENEEKKDDTMIIEDSVHWDKKRVFAYGINSESIRRLTDDPYPVSGYAVSRNGQWMLTALEMSPHYGIDGQPKPEFYLYDLQNGGKTKILEGLQTPNNFQFTQDNQGFYFVADTSSNPQWNGAGVSLLYYYSLKDKNYQKVNLNWEQGLGIGYTLQGSHVIAFLANGATNRAAYYQKDGSQWRKTSLDFGDMKEHIGSLAISDDGKKIVFEHSTAGQLPVYYVADLAENKIANRQELVALNKKLKKKPTARYEVLRWKGYQDEEINGILYYPENYQEGKKYPLVLSIHGGPSGVDLDLWREGWSSYPNIFSQRGAFVLTPNYHGSSNHGLAFVESIKQNYYDPELTDIINAINLLADKGMVDKDKLGVSGWSNGAILTTMLTVRYPDMFKAAAPGAGDVNWTSDYGTCEFGVTFDQSYFGGAPWDDVDGKTYNETYVLKSPLFEMEKVKTPTIIFHGSEDRAVPRDQGWEYYRALQQNRQAPVKFLWFPGQPHGLQKVTHQLRKMNEELDWFDKYLFKTYEPENESLKEGSPLAVLLSREKAAKEKSLYGKTKNGVLVPEVMPVAEDSLAIACFEVTNAQYQAFDPKHTFDAAQANYPVHDISLDKAKAYTQWLSQKTGEKYRLPNAKEAKKMQEQARKIGPKENTLNYWAGYDLTWDDAQQLRSKISEAKTTLLKEVGNYKPAEIGQATVYDLGGNVAEWDSQGNTYGYSAYDLVDANHQEAKPDQKYVGFRVVREAR